jgi:hypothetical protein
MWENHLRVPFPGEEESKHHSSGWYIPTLQEIGKKGFKVETGQTKDESKATKHRWVNAKTPHRTAVHLPSLIGSNVYLLLIKETELNERRHATVAEDLVNLMRKIL